MPATYPPRPTRPGLDRHDIARDLDRREREHLREHDRDPGFGGRPPGENRPTGGGGDGDHGGDGFRGRGPRELLGRYRLALSFFLAADLVFFLSLVSAFFVQHAPVALDAAGNYMPQLNPELRPVAIPTALWIATGFLILSCVTLEYGRRQLFHEMDVIEEWLGLGRPMAGRTWPWLAATAALGGAYLAGVSLAWCEVVSGGIRFTSSANSTFFFVLTGAHSAHIVLGLLLLSAACWGLYRLRRVEQRQVFVDCIAWFWHTMGAFWLALFALLLLAR